MARTFKIVRVKPAPETAEVLVGTSGRIITMPQCATVSYSELATTYPNMVKLKITDQYFSVKDLDELINFAAALKDAIKEPQNS